MLTLVFFLCTAQDSTAVVKGVVTLKGDRPLQKRLKPDHDEEQFLKAYPDGVPYDPVQVGKDYRVKWALVYVKKGLEGRTFSAPKEKVGLDIKDFAFSQRVLGIVVGQELVITGHDHLVHTAHVLPFVQDNKESNDAIEKNGEARRRTFAAPELGILVKCDLHEACENAWVSVLPHPFFAVTGEKGEYEIQGLAPGRYTVEAWQENCGPVTQEIEAIAGESKVIDFQIDLRVCAHLFVSGRVQGVGFRASTQEEAKKIGGLVGWVKNLSDGRVEAVIQGPREKVEKLVQWCRKGPSTADVTKVERTDEPSNRELKTFEVRY
jgi:acylphosphatase